MWKEILPKLYRNPLGLLQRAIYKGLIAPFKYAQGHDYQAQRYWQDRFLKYGPTLQAVGDEGLSESENAQEYAQAYNTLIQLCWQEQIDLAQSQVLEIGCGSGFYTQLFHDQGVKDYVGIDITNVLFSSLQTKFPTYHFIQQDVTTQLIKVEPQFDLVIMIDVIEHIVTPEKLTFALQNLQRCLKPAGVLMLCPIMPKHQKRLFYLHFWTLEDIKMAFSENYLFRPLVPFRKHHLLVIKNSYRRQPG